jgi:hypothetical protein
VTFNLSLIGLGLSWPVESTQLFQSFYQYVEYLFAWSNKVQVFEKLSSHKDGFVNPKLEGISLANIQSQYFGNNSFMSQTQSYYGAYRVNLAKSLSLYELEHHAQAALQYIANLPFNDNNKAL